MNSRLTKFFVLALIVVIIAGAASAFAAANTVPVSYAGDGSAVINGYNITNVHYTLSAADPRNIGTVTFTLDHAASAVQVKLVSTDPVTAFIPCTITGVSVSCPINGSVTVLAANQLYVIAVE